VCPFTSPALPVSCTASAVLHQLYQCTTTCVCNLRAPVQVMGLELMCADVLVHSACRRRPHSQSLLKVRPGLAIVPLGIPVMSAVLHWCSCDGCDSLANTPAGSAIAVELWCHWCSCTISVRSHDTFSLLGSMRCVHDQVVMAAGGDVGCTWHGAVTFTEA
jgi:hypothetical protein